MHWDRLAPPKFAGAKMCESFPKTRHGPHPEHMYGAISGSAQQGPPLAQQWNPVDRSPHGPGGFPESMKGQSAAVTPKKLEVRGPQRQGKGVSLRNHKRVPPEKEPILDTNNTKAAHL